MEDAIVRSNDFPVRLPVFEGPLDLLLYLVRKHEVDIHDIPIQTVTQQYLAILRGMEKLDLELAGEFFVMAATLMQIKSRMLLPRNEMATNGADAAEEAEALDPRWELVQQLLEYKKFKEAAGSLEDLITKTQDHLSRVVGDPSAAKEEPDPARPTDRIELWNTFNTILRRLSERLTVGTIRADTVTVADRMELILKFLETRDTFNFSDIFVGEEDVPITTFVATFLAILELTRLKRIHVEQTEDFGDVRCRNRIDGEALFQVGLVSEFDGPVDDGEPTLFDQNRGESSEEEELDEDDLGFFAPVPSLDQPLRPIQDNSGVTPQEVDEVTEDEGFDDDEFEDDSEDDIDDETGPSDSVESKP